MPPPTERGGRSIVWVPLIFVALAAGFAAGGVCGYFYDQHTREPNDGREPGTVASDKVGALGRIEPRDGVLSLGVAAPDRILKIKVEEDETVVKGHPLVILESQQMRKLEKEMAEIQFREASTRLQAIKKNGAAQIAVAELRRDRINELKPIEIKMLKSKIALLMKQQKNAKLNYERYVEAGDTIAGMDKDKQKLSEEQILSEIAATEDQLAKFRTSSEVDFRLAKAQVEAAIAELQQTKSTISEDSLRNQVNQAEERGKESAILAPSAGKILRIFVHEGDLVQSKPILQMANVNDMIVIAEVDEKDIQRVERDQSVIITSPSNAFDKNCNEVTGKVLWKAKNVGKAEMIPLDPRAAVSDRVVQVKIAVDQPECVAKLIGLQVRVEIATEK